MSFMIQILGVIFGLGMLYLTYVYLRRKEFSIRDTIFWTIIWLGFVLLVIFSSSANILLESLHIYRAMDLFTMIGFVVMSMVLFHLYVSYKRVNKKIENLTRKIAISNDKTTETTQ